MKSNFTNQLCLVVAWLLASTLGFAQQPDPLEIATAHVRSNFSDWGLTAQDIEGMTISDMYTDRSTGISRVYFMQRHQGIPVYNAIQNLSITKEGDVFFVGKRFIPNLAEKVNTTIPVLSAEQAVRKFAAHIGLPDEPLRLAQKVSETEIIFEKGKLAQEDIKVKLNYQPYHDRVLLSWDVTLFPLNSSDMWSARIDAVAGDILNQANWTVYCKVDGSAFRHLNNASEEESNHLHEALTYDFSAASAVYNVWPAPIESPNHGPRSFVEDPADTTASPYGWHDTDGQPGAEYTITRGNNAHAYEDSGNLNSSAGNEPDGGTNLIFDFPFDISWEPQQFVDAATVNLFYWNNVMHDFAYNYGFTEAAGNFQVNNYGNGGTGNDHVRAEAQDGSGTNNANFSAPPDGTSGRMQMYLWSNSSASYFKVDEPASVAGGYGTILPTSGWGAGALPSDTPVTGEVVIVDDGVPDPFTSDACQPLINEAEINGKIALIDRGGCEFGFKAYSAQNAGAIAVIICDIPGASPTSGMAGGVYGPDVHIPVVMLTTNTCQTIRQFAGNGLIATFQSPQVGSGPSQLDGDLDNGIIAHEYGHGISTRLTGGPSQSGCLGNAEQMGEGWSDFLALVTSVKPGDTGDAARGMGTYAFGQATTGSGIRNYPYSTNMDVNPWTYGDVAGNQEVHDLGEIWATMLWDLYWRMTDEYGWDEDLYYGTGGNNMAIRLVFQGMATQPCNPGFVDGRDAILAADNAINGGANQCLIWEVFARRGVGFSASQGATSSAGDQVEAFDVPCACRNSVFISKSVTDFIIAGDEIEVSIDVSNCKQETVTNVKVFDELPGGTSFKAGSANFPATVQGNSVVFDLGSMSFEDEKTITYTLTTSPDKYSIRYFLDDVPTEDSDADWEYYYIGNQAANIWSIQDAVSHSPDFAWSCEDIETESVQALELLAPWKVIGNRPVLRFYHIYDTEPGADGGLVDIKDTSAFIWTQVPDKMLRNGYPGSLQYTTFAFPVQAFSGNSGPDFKATYVDLSEWAGKDVVLRFRFGTDENTAGPLGWVVDDIEFMDLFSYNGQACITTDQGDNLCAFAPEEGTIVESKIISGTVEQIQDLSVAIFPNPAKNLLYLAMSSNTQQEVSISLFTLEGKQVLSRTANVFGNQQISLNVDNLPSGMYFVRINAGEENTVKKVVIK